MAERAAGTTIAARSGKADSMSRDNVCSSLFLLVRVRVSERSDSELGAALLLQKQRRSRSCSKEPTAAEDKAISASSSLGGDSSVWRHTKIQTATPSSIYFWFVASFCRESRTGSLATTARTEKPGALGARDGARSDANNRRPSEADSPPLWLSRGLIVVGVRSTFVTNSV